MKIIVYAISKNEERFVERWFNSMKEADEIYVLDTGSTDNTVSKLKKLGVNVVEKEINPWRFDVARNASLKLVPNNIDICVCTDLDEVFLPGWRKELENVWENGITRVNYNYNWRLDELNNPKVSFYISKIHSRKGYKWIHPVHEVLECDLDREQVITTELITLNHYPDNTKSRSSYLTLLELSVKEEPENDRNMHYLGREYMYYGRWNECIDTLIKHLSLKSANWKDERCASMRFIGRSYINLKRYEEASMWLEKAIKEAPYLREPYIEMAILKYKLKDWNEVEKNCLEALNIKDKPKTYINEQFSWDSTVYDFLSLSSYYLDKKEEALRYIDIAISMSNDERLIKNRIIFESM